MTLNTGKGKLSVYHGHAEAEKDGTVVFAKDAEFHMKEDGMEADSLGERTCLCAYEKEDYSGNEYRFRDDPVEENYDCTGLVVQVMGGLVIMGGVTIASGIVATAVGAGASATMIMGATAVGGTTFVAGLAATDLISRRVSSMEEYMKTALAGSVVGALTGAAELVPVGGLARVGVDFLAGTSGSAAGQLITEGEVDAERMFREGVLAAVLAAGARMLRGSEVKKIATGSENKMYRKKKDPSIPDPMPKRQLRRIVKAFKKQGGVIQMDDATDRYLEEKLAEGITLNENTILLRQKPGRASVFEELIHATQFRKGLNDGSAISRLKNEIAAQKKLLKYCDAYKLTPLEIKQTKAALESYTKELEKLLGGI